MVKDPYKEWDSGHFCALLVDLGVPCDKKQLVQLQVLNLGGWEGFRKLSTSTSNA